MEFVTAIPNHSRLRELNAEAFDCLDLSHVEAAVAYAGNYDHPLLEKSLKHRKPLRFYGRYDETVPIAPIVLKWFLDRKSEDYRCRLVPDYFHAKVVWWHGYGAYIGSANLTKRAWDDNVEAGIFYTESELEEHGLDTEFEAFFEQLEKISHPLTEELYQEAEKFAHHSTALADAEREQKREFEKSRLLPRLPSGLLHYKKPARDIRRERFLKEWNSTLQSLRNLAGRVSSDEYRPGWVNPTVSASLQCDRFLHKYYLEFSLKGGKGSRHRELHEKNLNRVTEAEQAALEWWKQMPADSETQYVFEQSGPIVSRLLISEQLKRWTSEDLAELCLHVHAMHDHGARVGADVMGLRIEPKNQQERVRAFGRWLHSQRSAAPAKLSVMDVIQRLFYGGDELGLTQRLADLYFDSNLRVPHFGLSAMGELAGWGLPDKFPLRNDRTSKALYALGHNVSIFGD